MQGGAPLLGVLESPLMVEGKIPMEFEVWTPCRPWPSATSCLASSRVDGGGWVDLGGS